MKWHVNLLTNLNVSALLLEIFPDKCKASHCQCTMQDVVFSQASFGLKYTPENFHYLEELNLLKCILMMFWLIRKQQQNITED